MVVASHKTENVIIVMLDGLRWQEVFHGADRKLIDKRSPKLLGASEQRTSQAKELYWRDSAEERRQALMPFLWSVMASHGQVFGNRDLHSDSHVKNGLKFSYPGYNETLTGFPDDWRIHSNNPCRQSECHRPGMAQPKPLVQRQSGGVWRMGDL